MCHAFMCATEKAHAAKVKEQEARRAKRMHAIGNARERMEHDPFYRLLHMAVAVLFAQQLAADLQAFKADKSVSSLAAKWAPTPWREWLLAWSLGLYGIGG